MNGLWLENQALTVRNDLAVPVPVVGEALIKPRLCGISGTDLELVRGYHAFTGIPGHEFVGDVADAPGHPEWVGKRVTGEINITCGQCESCRRGKYRHCLKRRTLGMRDWPGVFAEYFLLPLSNLHLVPQGLSDEQAVFTEPLAASLEILEQVPITPAEQVLVIGAGRLGLLVAHCLAQTGCAISVVARQERSRAILSAWGIPTLEPERVAPVSADVVVDATGSPDGLALALRAVRPTGTAVIKSTYHGDTTVDFSTIVVNEIRVVGSRCGPFPTALAYFESNQFDPAPLVDGRFTLAKGIEAFELAAQRGTLKVFIEPDRV